MLSFVGLVPSCHWAFVGISRFESIFSRIFRGSQIFSRGYFVGPKVFFVGISWVRKFFSLVFRESQIFSRGYFVGPKFFLMGILWVQIFSSWVQNFLSWVILSCWPHDKKWHRNISETACSIPNRFHLL